MDDIIEWKEAKGGHQSAVGTSEDDQQTRTFHLIRNITSLADARYHKAKYNDYSWIDNAVVSISPDGHSILFYDKTLFYAKLRLEPANEYVTKPLNIPLDINDQVTSLLCLPIMSKQNTALGMVDWTALIVGLSSGYVKFYTEQSICLLSLKFSDEPVVNIKCQTQKNPNGRSKTHFPTIVDELMIIYQTMTVIIDGTEVYENLRLSRDEVIKSNSTYEPSYDLNNLPSILNCQKWVSRKNIFDADLLGSRRTTKFDSLLSESVEPDNEPPKTSGRSLVIVGRNPFVRFFKESKDVQTQSYTQMIGSIFSQWSKPQPSTTQIAEVTKYNYLPIFDRDRSARSVISSPDKRLVVVTDDFGRVLLVDCANRMIVRMWKGYRSAQCGWIEVKRNPDKQDSPNALFLVIYAPKRGLLEVWSAQRGPRVIAFNVGKHCRLLYSGYIMLNMRADRTGQSASQSYSTNCYLLDAKSGYIFSVEVPYSYSLYKYGDIKSRDHLLVAELSQAIQTDSQVEQISEILLRISLPESLQISIQKVALSLFPEKIIPIMMNLINKIMENYELDSAEMIYDDQSIVELCRRIIRISSTFNDLSQSALQELPLPDVNIRLIEEYEEHPEEIDEFSEKLGWSAAEVLRYLSLLSLERSYSAEHVSNPWPSLGEPLAWPDFISCFSLTRAKKKSFTGETCIRLKHLNKLNQDKLVKTSLFLYNKLAQDFYNNPIVGSCDDLTSFLHPTSRLNLLFQFWLSTKLCNHWKMWPFLQNQVWQISDELKVISMEQNNDSVLLRSWKEIYNLILETDNIFAAITATASIRSNTLRMIEDQSKIENKEEEGEDHKLKSNELHIDWECICIDAERLSLLCQQLEDVFLLHLLLRYSVIDGHLKDNLFVYRITRLSVANILRSGPTVVTDLVSQWAIQANLNLKIFTEPYGQEIEDRQLMRKADNLNNEEHAKELLHHTLTSFPLSLEPDVIISYCIWDLCRSWMKNSNIKFLHKAYEGISLVKSVELRRKLCNAAYKTFFQRTIENLVVLIETNTNIVKVRDQLIRKELNISEDCIEDFVEFCCNFSELMLQEAGTQAEVDQQQFELKFDNWWSMPDTMGAANESASLIETILTSSLLDVDSLVELNRTSNLLNLILKLKIMKSHPASLLNQETNSTSELRRKFARRCICNIVAKIADEMGDFNEEDEDEHSNVAKLDHVETSKANDPSKSPFIVDKKRTYSGTDLSSDHNDEFVISNEGNNQTMILFANLLSLAKDWNMNCDELHLEFVFELYRCNLDRMAAQISTRVFDKQTLASGLLKISSQRVLVLFGLSPNVSDSTRWKGRSDIWSNFQPNVGSWLKSIQQEEIRREIACLSFSQFAKVDEVDKSAEGGWIGAFGVKLFVLESVRRRTRIVMEGITNHLEGQAERLAYDLLELLESQLFDKFLAKESEQSG